jgi:hypothetical protein
MKMSMLVPVSVETSLGKLAVSRQKLAWVVSHDNVSNAT